MKKINQLICLGMFFCSMTDAMEIESRKLFPKKKEREQLAQQQAHDYLHKTACTLKLSDIPTTFGTLSRECKRNIIKNLSTLRLYMHCIAIHLPMDVIKNKILVYMLDNEPKAAEKFYNQPVMESFARYYNIQVMLGRANQPIGPLYKLDPGKCANILGKINPWYYSNPILTIDEQTEIDQDPNLKQYFTGKEVIILPRDEQNDCTPLCACKIIGGTCGAGACLTGIMFAGGAAFGACGFCGAKVIICEPAFLSTVLAVGFGLVPCVGAMTWALGGIESLKRHSQQITM